MRFRFSAIVFGLGLAVSANASQLFSNGSFGTGSLSSWSTGATASSDDAFTVQTGNTTPLNGFPTVGPDGGTDYAVSDGTGLVTPESTYLVQTITIPVADAYLFSADIFVNDQFGAGGLGGELAIWANSVDPLTTAPLYIIYGPNDAPVINGVPNNYVLVSQDITAQVTAGTTYQIGVLEGDSSGPINVGVDNFSLLATPEPAMLFPTAFLAAGMFLYRARRKLRGQI